jgi:hypothetical protein
VWRMPVAGGAATKVLDGVFRSNFAVLEGGIYYIEESPEAPGVSSGERSSGETRLRYFDFATNSSRTNCPQPGKRRTRSDPRLLTAGQSSTRGETPPSTT